MKLIQVAFICSLLMACVTAPVQEMSNARQAVSAAIELGASKNVQGQAMLDKAEQEIKFAEAAITKRHYRQSREHALLALQYANQARATVAYE